MQKALHLRATVQPGGRVEIASPELEAGADGGCGDIADADAIGSFGLADYL